jgi:hypothetical protein
LVDIDAVVQDRVLIGMEDALKFAASERSISRRKQQCYEEESCCNDADQSKG